MEALRERFGKYHVLEKIAQGGMAEVYKVKTVGIAGFEKIQALKRILPHSAREGRFIRSFIDEARIAVELTHRNIVQVFDFGKADGELFMAMELIEGRDLRTATQQATDRSLPAPIAVAAYVIGEVASGLDYAHRKTDGFGGGLGIVHCDVSPSNVMMSSEGYVKILDFGIARATFSSALERRRLRGKPRYMAPEQTIGEPATAASDVFALGIIAWELFTGLPLYRGADVKAILEAVRRTVPPRVDRLNPEVPAVLVDAIQTALQREPSARGSAADLGAACMRAAMPAGARGLAAWLEELDARPSRPAAQPEQDDSIAGVHPLPSAPPEVTRTSHSHRSGSASHTPMPPGEPPLRPSTRSMTADAFPAYVGGFEREPTETSTSGHAHRAATLGRAQPVALPGVAPSPSAFGDRDPTSTSHRRRDEATPPPLPVDRFGRDETPPPRSGRLGRELTPPPEPTRPSAPPPRFDLDTPPPTSTTQQAWAHDGTTMGVARFADALLPPEPAHERAETTVDPHRPLVRTSYARLEVAPGTPASSLSFDDDHTDFSSQPAVAFGDATSFDELELEPQRAETEAAPPVDEPIDDDLARAAPGALAERRKTVIVAGALDGAPKETLRSIARSIGELAYQRGGVALAVEDDGLVVAFGLEIAGEDDVAIAMGWALDAAALVREAGDDQGGEPRLRIGARAGVPTGAGEADAPRIPPDAIEEARALAREATPDRPMFLGAAGRMTSELFALREVPAPKRIARRSRVMEVVGPRSYDERDRARLERRGKFVGRTAQLAELEVWFHRAIAADRRLSVLVTGAAGTGKSRLVSELIARRQAALPALRVVSIAAHPASRHAPFALVIELYQASLGLPPGRGRTARAQLAQRLVHLATSAGLAEDRARAIAVDLDRAMELRDGASVVAAEVADLRPRVSAGLAAFRAAMTDRAKPMITLIEDLHLADGASLEVLRHGLQVQANGPELLVVTARPEGAAPPAVDVSIAVGDLVGGDLRALIADRLGDAATPLNVAAVIARAGGNPLFVEELAQAVRDAGPTPGEIPASARDVIVARVDRLSTRAKAALRYAAVIGGAARTRLLEELLAEEPGGGDDPAPALDELVEADFLVRGAASAGDGELGFARGLVREVIYDALPVRARRDMHARIGRLLASRFFAGREEPPAVIAEHLERGGEPAGSAAFWLRAGRLALAASDADAAVSAFSRTLHLERDLGDEPPTPTSRARRRDALAGREEANRMRGDFVSDPHDLDELEALCEGNLRRLADISVRRAQRLLRVGDYAGATAATVAAEDYSIASGDARTRGEALRTRGEVLERLGRFDEALVVVGDACELFAREGAVSEEMAAMIGRGRIHLMRAHYEAARDAYKPVIARIDKTGDPWLERVAANHVAIIEMCLGNYAVAMASAERSLELCRRYGDRAREGDALSVAGIILMHVGIYEQAAPMFAEALELLARTQSRWGRADCLIYAGACELRRGHTGGLAMIDEALAEARRLGARYLEANALITRAGARLRVRDFAAAHSDATQGAAIARAATLVGYEIQGLTRAALALVRDPQAGRLGEAGTLAHRALVLLEQQRYLEGSEEEVYAGCAEVMRACGAADRAANVMARGKAEVQRKLAALEAADEAWAEAYRGMVEHAELLR